MLARFLQGFFEEKLSRAAAARGNPEKAEAGRAGEDSFERMTASALKVAQLPGAEARAATLQLLHALFPAWPVQSIRGIFGLFPIWFVARHASCTRSSGYPGWREKRAAGWRGGGEDRPPPSATLELACTSADNGLTYRSMWANDAGCSAEL